MGKPERAHRGRVRILELIGQLQALSSEVKCPACHVELARQIGLQIDALREIAQTWEFKVNSDNFGSGSALN